MLALVLLQQLGLVSKWHKSIQAHQPYFSQPLNTKATNTLHLLLALHTMLGCLRAQSSTSSGLMPLRLAWCAKCCSSVASTGIGT